MEINLTLPTRWSELMADQLEEIARIFLRYSDKKEVLTHCLMLFAQWKIVRWKMFFSNDSSYFFFSQKSKKVFCISGDLFKTLCDRIRWVTEGFWIPSYVPPIEGFHTPHLMLYEISVEQFLTADSFYSRYSTTADQKFLNRMLATLYCDNFRSLDLEFAGEAMGRRQYFRRFAAFMWYSGVKAWLKQRYPYIFTESTDEPTEPDATVMNILSMLNGGDITRNEQILKAPMHQAFYELNQKIENAKTKKHV